MNPIRKWAFWLGTVTVAGLPWQFVVPAVNHRAATNRGLGTGQIEIREGDFVNVRSTNPNHLLTLPDNVVGVKLTIYSDGDAYQLQSTIPETIAINGGKGEQARTRVPGGVTVFATCVSATKWIAQGIDSDGEPVLISPAAP